MCMNERIRFAKPSLIKTNSGQENESLGNRCMAKVKPEFSLGRQITFIFTWQLLSVQTWGRGACGSQLCEERATGHNAGNWRGKDGKRRWTQGMFKR